MARSNTTEWDPSDDGYRDEDYYSDYWPGEGDYDREENYVSVWRTDSEDMQPSEPAAATECLTAPAAETCLVVPTPHAAPDMQARETSATTAEIRAPDAVALAEADANWARRQIRETWRLQQRAEGGDTADSGAMSAAAAPATHDRETARDERAGRPRVPLSVRVLPQAWRPAVHDVLLVTGVWRDVVWLWDESHEHSHHGVGLLTSQWLLGDVPHWMPTANRRVIISAVTDDESGLAVLHMAGVQPDGWSSGWCMWLIRWLDGV